MKTTSSITSKTMNFKDRVSIDVDKVFLNLDVFAETADINGVNMSIVRDDFVNPADTKARMGNVEKQIAFYDVQFHVSASNFEHIPQSDMLMDFDGEEYRIKKVSEDMGMLMISLSRVDS